MNTSFHSVVEALMQKVDDFRELPVAVDISIDRERVRNALQSAVASTRVAGRAEFADWVLARVATAEVNDPQLAALKSKLRSATAQMKAAVSSGLDHDAELADQLSAISALYDHQQKKAHTR